MDYPWEVDSASFSLGGNFDIWVLPWGREFDMAKSCFSKKKKIPRAVFSLTFSSAGEEQFLIGIFLKRLIYRRVPIVGTLLTFGIISLWGSLLLANRNRLQVELA